MFYGKHSDKEFIHRSELGKLGEDLACKNLTGKGYRVIERNYRKPWGEIDIVAIAPDKTLVFIEVKTVKGDDVDNLSITPEMQLTSAKLKKLKRTCSLYTESLPEKVNQKMGWRIDLVALTIREKDCLLKHYQNIVG